MIDLKKEIGDNEVLVVLSGEDYQKILMDIIKEAERLFDKVCYATLNKPYTYLVDLFKKNNVDIKKFGFIDAITTTVMKPGSAKNCVFISSPKALTEMSIVLTKVCKTYNPNLLIFDSLSALLIYEKGPTVVRFIHSIIEHTRMYKVAAIFIALKSDIDSALIKDLRMFADKIINL